MKHSSIQEEYRRNAIATFAIPAYWQGQICQEGYAIKQDARGKWGVCKARLDRSEPSGSSERFVIGKFISSRRYPAPEAAAHAAHQAAN